MTSDRDAEELLAEDLTEYLTPDNFKKNFTPVTSEFVPQRWDRQLEIFKGLT